MKCCPWLLGFGTLCELKARRCNTQECAFFQTYAGDAADKNLLPVEVLGHEQYLDDTRPGRDIQVPCRGRHHQAAALISDYDGLPRAHPGSGLSRWKRHGAPPHASDMDFDCTPFDLFPDDHQVDGDGDLTGAFVVYGGKTGTIFNGACSGVL